MNKTNQKGFSAVLILLIVIMLVIIGFAAWYVWDKQHGSKATTPQNQQLDRDNNQTNQSSNQQNTQSSNSKNNLVITEWGVQIPLTDEIFDAAYYINSSGGDETAAIYMTSFANIAANCRTATSGSIIRFTDPNMQLPSPFEGQTIGQRYGTSTKIGNYYYAYVTPQSTCGTGDGTNINPSIASQSAAVIAVKKAVQNIQATN